MRIKSLLIIIVTNIFLMLFTSIVLEYVNLSERFQMLENTVQSSLNLALDAATASEEMFTEDFQNEVASFASDESSTTSYATTLLWRDNSWHQINSYQLARYYNNNRNTMPANSGDIAAVGNLGGSDVLADTYKWLYGNRGTIYTQSSLSWANRNKKMIEAYRGKPSTRTAVHRFKTYVDNIGIKQQTVGYLKKRIPSTQTFSLEMKTYPTLVNMGLKLHDYNENKSLTHDNFTSSYHYGKANKNFKKTIYYLTPASLGVTYVPVEVLKPIFVANLETLARLNKLSGSDTENMTEAEVISTLNSADHCLPTSVYKSNGRTLQEHTQSLFFKPGSLITDGLIEYDLGSAKVKVDYFFIDFADTARRSENATIISKIEGCIAQRDGSYRLEDESQTTLRNLTLQRFLSDNYDSQSEVSDSAFPGAYDKVKDKRIVARVSVKLKVHVCYQSPILQWLCDLDGTNHYDIKLWNPETNDAVESSDGIWYQYTTYYCQTR